MSRDSVAVAARPGLAALTDGAALSVSAMITGVVGLFCWLVAAATLPQTAVGESSAFVSGFMLVAGIAQLNVGLGMLRWLPLAGRLTGRIVLGAYVLVAIVAAAGAGVFLLLPAGDVVRRATHGGWPLFVVAAVCWAMFQLQDYVLASLGKAWWVPMFNGTFGLVRVAVLPVLGIALGALGVLVSWIAPTAMMMIVAIVAIARLAPRRVGPATLPASPEVLSYLGPTYLATLGTTLLYNSVPLLVVSAHGTASGATFFVMWTGVNAVDYAINGFVNSLVLRGSRHPQELPVVLRTVGSKLLPLVIVGALVGVVLAPFLLGLFGHAYAEQGVLPLRLLLLGMVVRTVIALAVGARLAAGKGIGAAVVQAASTVLVLSAVLLAPPSTGLVGPAVGFVVAQVLVAATVAPGLVRTVFFGKGVAW